MREILFRGKRIDNGEWVEGTYYKQTHFYGDPCEEHYIITSSETLGYDQALDFSEVDPSTVGQYTGLTDKNGERIFEGDIGLLDDEKGVVNYGTGCFCVRLKGPDYLSRCNPAIDIVLNEYPGFEIIGNIHDNPELLKGGGAE